MIRRKLHERMYRDLLGPGKEGIYEEFLDDESPIDKYSLGILGFEEREKSNEDEDTYDEKYEKGKTGKNAKKKIRGNSRQEEDFDGNAGVNEKSGKPSIFGLSFLLSKKTKMDVLMTWATYEKSEGKWRRIGHWTSFTKSSDEIGEGSIECQKDDCENEIRFHLTKSQRSMQGECEQISVYMRNINLAGEKHVEGHIFQPQIRIILHERKNRKGWMKNEKTGLDILFRNKQVYAKGKNCSAVWREIDNSKYFMNKGVPFNWPDVENIPKDEGKKFVEPDIRTEFLPYYQITQPNFVPKDLDDKVFDSAKMSQWKTENLVELDSFIESYERWVNEFDRNEIEKGYQNEFDKNLSSCRDLIRRMKEGRKELSRDKDVLLAFNIMNEAINRQSKWTRKTSEPFRWRAFQIAFVLASIKGILKDDESEREMCDLLWFPTGSGKTEAYLGLASLLIAYKRITVDNDSDSAKHVGTVVLSRYTLRFLTIQQFRRSTAVFTALECIRTERWVPEWYKEKIKFYEKRFSIGLWVGDSVTPNNMDDAKIALLKPKQEQKEKKVSSEPAQVIDCPVCGHIVSCTDTSFVKDKPRKIHWVVSSENDLTTDTFFVKWKKKERQHKYKIEERPTVIKKGNSYIISMSIEALGEVEQNLIDGLWKEVVEEVNGIKSEFVRASRPGYFLYSKDGRSSGDNDFSIHCTNPECSLNNSDSGWSDLTPSGAAQFPTIFQDSENNDRSWSIPIPCYTVDDQIFDNCPNMIIMTADKIARLTWNPRGASIFGNVDVYCGDDKKFIRIIDTENSYPGKKKVMRHLHFGCSKDKRVEVEPPSLILQDELHLIDGPLGSMVGLYESAVELLCTSEENRKPKYIASSATVNAASKQVKSLYSKEVRIFPPNVEDIDDNYFSWKENNYEIDDRKKGRLYVGLDTSSAKSPITLAANSWATILQGVGDEYDLLKKAGPTDDELAELDSFWTLVGYFNAKRELSNTRGVYRDDIPERMGNRSLDESNIERVWGETKANNLPGILDRIKTPSDSIDSMNTLDVIFCTSMFGTGIDIDRLALMYMVGQPKTTSNYIQASGRIGRQSGGLAVIQLRATAPRDKNQYEFFNGYHHALHYFVEPVTVYPFATGTLDIALGPVIVMLLRNAKQINGKKVDKKWVMDPNGIIDSSNAALIDEIKKYFVERAMNQPDGRKLDEKTYVDCVDSSINKWITAKNELDREGKKLYYEWYTRGRKPRDVVLGDSKASKRESVRVVYENTPQSLRSTEDTLALGVGSIYENPLVRPSQFTYTYGAGSIYETNIGTRIIPEISEWRGNNFDIGTWANSNNEIINSHFSISEDLKGAKVFMLPTNNDMPSTKGEEEDDDRKSIIELWAFPSWKRCIGSDDHRGQSYIFELNKCPKCKKETETSVRFIRVCQRGHMDDVDWIWQVHGESDCSSTYLEWEETSKSIKGISVKCPKCKKKKNMQEIYSAEGRCNGWWAETHKRDTKCEVTSNVQEKMYVTIKSAPSNRYPVSNSFLAIAATDRSKERRLATRIKDVVSDLRDFRGLKKEKLAKDMFDYFEEKKKTAGKLVIERQRVFSAMKFDKKNEPLEWEAKWDKIFYDVVDFEDSRVNTGPEDNYAVLLNEFKNLTDASERQLSTENDVFDVNYPGIFSVNLNKKIKLKVTPVTRITVDSVQIGYKRTPKGPNYSCKVNNNVIPGHKDHQELEVQIARTKPFRKALPDGGVDKWYPGIREKGEGIFISSADLNSDSILAMSEDRGFKESVLNWRDLEKMEKVEMEESTDRMNHIKYNEVYVWWHSFAHRIIDSLAMDSGYSSASIRERVYFDQDQKFGGCLIFAHTAGEDGTLGGLVSLANPDDFKNVLLNAKEKVFECSNGPLCSEGGNDTLSPSSCYACMFMSETTCVHSNRYLDRSILRNW